MEKNRNLLSIIYTYPKVWMSLNRQVFRYQHFVEFITNIFSCSQIKRKPNTFNTDKITKWRSSSHRVKFFLLYGSSHGTIPMKTIQISDY